MTLAGNTTARFWSKVRRPPSPTSGEDGCWDWAARVDRGGYGIFSVTRDKLVRAHRLSWLLSGQPDPGAACLLHRCGNHRCVKPEHLYIGSLHELKSDGHSVPSEGRPQSSLTTRMWSERRTAPSGDGHWTRRDRSRVPRGERSNLAKLREEDVVAIRRLHASGRHRNADLSAMFGVAERSIYHIIRRKTWTHVP